ncbi:MAG: DegT/DnrJ/EryC1/StrS family aminotransferase [Actinomycetota bacterium]|nr:DegT/DnrJ/EryC1/StrS family aminotransferase [Actinomycetota bacterium]
MRKQVWVSVGDFRIGQEERLAIEEVLESGRLSEGQKVKKFEEEFANFVGARHAIATSSGTSALMAGIMALTLHPDLSIRRGDQGNYYSFNLCRYL